MSSSTLSGRPLGELALQVTPDPFVRVQLGRVTGEELAVPSGVALEDLIDLLAFRGGSRVPKKDDRAAERAKEETEKDGDFRLADGAGVAMEIQPQALAPRTDPHRRDGRDLVVLVAMAEDGRLSPGCPRAPEGRNQEKAALVQEGQMGVQALAFFFRANHRYRSTGRPPPHRVRSPGVRVSGKTNGAWPRVVPRAPDESVCRTRAGSMRVVVQRSVV